MKKVSAPGKIILIGEHAVVYGEPEILAAVNMRTTVVAKKSDTVSYKHTNLGNNDLWRLDDVMKTTKKVLDLWNKGFEEKNFSKLFSDIKANKFENYKKAVVGIALKHLNIHDGISLEISSKLPIGAGLGSSASLSVAVVQAIASEYEKPINKKSINSIALEIEKIIHGTPPGGDNTACCFGGLLWFQKGHDFISLYKEIPYKLENFVLVNTKPSEKTTGELVQLVRDLPPNFRTEKVKTLGKAVMDMREALRKKDFVRMKELINVAQNNLKQLGVSSEEIDNIVDEIDSLGGAAKLCGAGGGGIVLCYHEDKQKLLDTIKEIGYKPLETELGTEGVKIEG